MPSVSHAPPAPPLVLDPGPPPRDASAAPVSATPDARISAARPASRRWPLEAVATGLAFVSMFAAPLYVLVHEWLTRAEAGHGSLLAGVALWHVWTNREAQPGMPPARATGLALVVVSGMLAYLSQIGVPSRIGVRVAMLGVLLGIVLYYRGWSQVRRWWMPAGLLVLSIPLPGSLVATAALPLQLVASRLGAFLLEFRNVPVAIAGNVIRIPGHDLFITEACSGLRSLASLVSLAVLAGGLWLRTPIGRMALVLAAVPIAIALNGVRIFLTGFLTFFVSPTAGQGFMHVTEGWLLFLIALAALGLAGWAVVILEKFARRKAR